MAIIYASPTGSPTGAGTLDDPYNLATGITNQQVGDTLYLLGGVYDVTSLLAQINAVPMGPSNSGTQRSVIRNYPGQRPLLTVTSGPHTGPPSIIMGPYLTLDGLWFCGPKRTTASAVQGNDGKLIRNCTFSGYMGCLVDGDSVNNAYYNNRLINCSGGNFYPDQYISRRLFSSGQVGPVHQGNIHIGGDSSYQIQLWHDPRNATIRNNFCADSYDVIAVQGINHLIEDNIFWSAATLAYPTINFAREGDGEFGPPVLDAAYVVQHNYFGQVGLTHFGWPSTPGGNYPPLTTTVAKNNRFGGPAPAPPLPYCSPYWFFGDYSVWTEDDILANLGVSTPTLNAAVSALETAFTQTPTQIQADTTIESNFAIIRTALNMWAAGGREVVGTSLSAIRQELSIRLSDLETGTATAAGTTTTLIDTTNRVENDDHWQNAWLLMSAGSNPNVVRRISTFVKSTGTLTFASGYPSATLLGDSYELHRRWSPANKLRAINAAIRDAYPYVHKPIIDETLTVSSNTYAYTVPSTMQDIYQVLVQVDTGISTYPYREIEDWRVEHNVSGGAIVPTLRLSPRDDLSVGNALRLIGTAPATTLTNDTDVLELSSGELSIVYNGAILKLWEMLFNDIPFTEIDTYKEHLAYYREKYEESKRLQGMPVPHGRSMLTRR